MRGENHGLQTHHKAKMWQGVYLYMGLHFKTLKNLTLEKARRAEDRV